MKQIPPLGASVTPAGAASLGSAEKSWEEIFGHSAWEELHSLTAGFLSLRPTIANHSGHCNVSELK